MTYAGFVYAAWGIGLGLILWRILRDHHLLRQAVQQRSRSKGPTHDR